MTTPPRFVLAGALFLGVASMAAFRASPAASVAGDFDCVVLEGDHGLSGAGDLFTNQTHSVVTPSGNATVTCRFRIPAGMEPSSMVQNDGFPCLTFGGLTYRSRSLATPGGVVSMTCQVTGATE